MAWRRGVVTVSFAPHDDAEAHDERCVVTVSLEGTR
jgi:hypothetical protein